jgi:hypothetical protein
MVSVYEVINAQVNSLEDPERYCIMTEGAVKDVPLPKGYPIVAPIYIGNPIIIEDE